MKKSGQKPQKKIINERKKVSKQIKDQLSPTIQKLLKICSSVKVMSRKDEWEEIKTILELLKKIQDIEANYQYVRSDRKDHWEAFYKWCSENGAEFDSVTVKEIEEGNYGVFAEKDIKEEEQFLVVPRKIMMTDVSAQESKLGPLISSNIILKNMPNVKVAMHLLYESLNPESFWAPYISILPSSYNTILYFNFKELQELQGSPVLDEVFTIIRSIARQYCYFFQHFENDYLAISLNIGPYFTYDLYRWAISSVMTRQNFVPRGEDLLSLALIPLFDMCNHAKGKLSTDFNLAKDSLVSLSCRPFSKGDEVFMFYGPRTNGEFFVHNGFVYLDTENDGIEIKMGISKNDPLQSQKTALCEKLEVSVNGPFYVYMIGISEELLLFLKVNVLKADELQNILNVEGDITLPETSDLTTRAYSFLKDRLFLLLKSYKTTLEEDEKTLEQDVFESSQQRLAFLLKFSEKRILTNVYEECIKTLEKL